MQALREDLHRTFDIATFNYLPPGDARVSMSCPPPLVETSHEPMIYRLPVLLILTARDRYCSDRIRSLDRLMSMGVRLSAATVLTVRMVSFGLALKLKFSSWRLLPACYSLVYS